MNKDPQGADNQVEQVIEELNIGDHGSAATTEGSSISKKAHQKDDLINKL